MALNEILADGVQPAVTTVVTLYTAQASGKGTRVTAFTATNNHAATTATYDLHIVPFGGSADATNKLVNAKSLASTESDVPPEVQNQMIPPGGTLEAKVSLATSIAFRASGIEF